MQYPVLVAESGTLEELVHETPHGDGVKRATIAMNIHVLFEVAFAVFEDEDELGLGMDDVVQPDDVDMFEFLHEGDLTDGGRGSTFLSI